MSALIEARGITKDFPAGETTQRVLHRVDLDVRAGEMLLMIGPSGSGKTTMISILAGILSATEGEVRVAGRALTGRSAAALARFRRETVGFIFQQYNLLPSLTASENAAIPLVVRGVSHRRAEARAREILESLGMGPHAGKLPKQLSGGQMQRVAIARALVHAPPVIVCDEPTAALDAASGRAAMEQLREASLAPANASGGRAVIVVTHDPRIYAFADRVVSMEDGRITQVLEGRAAIASLTEH
jgi:putative ABC transport system ATP-binding protein